MTRDGYLTSDPRAVRRHHIARRAVHLVSPAFLVYYLMDAEYLGVSKRFMVIVALMLVLSFEGARLRYRWRIPGTRRWELDRPSAAAMGGVGLGFSILLLPPHLVVATFLGMSAIDPLMGELRDAKVGRSDAIGFAGYAVLFAAVHLLFFPGFPPAFLLIYAPLASLLAVVAERRSPIWLDDDLAMQIAPLVVLVPLDLALGAGSLQIP